MIKETPISLTEIGEDLENWMTKLPEALKNIPIVYLAIPGSHDSGSCSITRSSAIAPDTAPAIRQLSKVFGPIVKRLVYNWVVTQHATITEQLKEGVRYLDLRLATKPQSKDLYFVHGLYGEVIGNILTEVKSFLDSHLGEIIILDFQHFYSLTVEDHTNMLHSIDRLFGNRLCPVTHNLTHITLNWMRSHGYQLIVIYRNPVHVPLFWPPAAWQTPWPDTTNVDTMLDFLNTRLAARPLNAGYVSQCVLTPDASFILRHPFSTLELRCASPCNHAIIPWLEKQTPGPNGVNIIISDFIKMPHIPFCKIIVSLNKKFLNDVDQRLGKGYSQWEVNE